jgi:hypothetical protein
LHDGVALLVGGVEPLAARSIAKLRGNLTPCAANPITESRPIEGSIR